MLRLSLADLSGMSQSCVPSLGLASMGEKKGREERGEAEKKRKNERARERKRRGFWLYASPTEKGSSGLWPRASYLKPSAGDSRTQEQTTMDLEPNSALAVMLDSWVLTAFAESGLCVPSLSACWHSEPKLFISTEGKVLKIHFCIL